MEEHFGQSSSEESREKQSESSRDGSSVAERFNVYNSVPDYSEQEVQVLGEMLVTNETFEEALEILISWLVKGECNERNYSSFSFLFQLCWDYSDKLQAEQKKYLKEIIRTGQALLDKQCRIQLQLSEMEKIFNVIDKHNIWINFTPNHLEKIQEMRKEILAFKQSALKDISNDVVEKEQNDMGIGDVESQNDVIKMKVKLGYLTYKLNIINKKTEEMETEQKKYANDLQKLREEIDMKKRLLKEETNLMIDGDNQHKNPTDVASQLNSDHIEMHMVSLLSIFLFNHPDGENIDCIYSYLNNYIPVAHAADIENLLKRYPKIFKESSPIGATQETKWTYISIDQKTFKELIH